MEILKKIDEDGLSLSKKEVDRDILLLALQEGKDVKETPHNFHLSYDYISGLDIWSLKKIKVKPELKPCQYRIKIESKGIFGGTSFFITSFFIDEKDREINLKKIKGCLYRNGNNILVLHKDAYKLVKYIEELNNIKKDIQKRGDAFSKIKKILPGDAICDNYIKNFQYFKVEKFGLDLVDGSTIVPEIRVDACLLNDRISEKFKNDFKSKGIGRHKEVKIDNLHIVYSNIVRKCFKALQETNTKSLSEKRGVFYNPKKFLKRILKEDIGDEDILDEVVDAIFEERDYWKSKRIKSLGVWEPKLGCYFSDNPNKYDWFQKDEDVLTFHLKDQLDRDYFVDINPEDMDKVLEKMKEEREKGKSFTSYKDQNIPINEDSIEEIKSKIEKIKNFSKRMDERKLNPKEKISKIVPLIKNNYDEEQYEKQQEKPLLFDKKIPAECLNKNTKLFDYQEKGISWLQESFLKRMPGVLFADDMGLGKTLQVLVFLVWLRKLYEEKNNTIKTKPFLVVAPKGLLKNWENEKEKHVTTSLERLFKGHGSFLRNRPKNQIIENMKKSFWVLTTYETLRDKEDIFREIEWGVCIFDEAQKIKNPNTLLSEMAKAMCSDFSIAITGTPIENSLKDFWSISDCVYPKKFGVLKDFHKEYCKSDENLDKLRKKALYEDPPFMKKRWKEDVLFKDKNFPKKRINPISKEMSKDQLNIYNSILKKVNAGVYDNPLTVLHKIKKYSLCIDKSVSDDELEKQNVKILLTCSLLENIKNKSEKVLIVVESRGLQQRLLPFLKNRFSLAFEPLLVNGEMSSEKRLSQVKAFDERTEEFDILLISPKAGGVGLTITCANHVIYMERWWNPAVEDQCTDRVYRIGQKKDVYVHIPIATLPKSSRRSFDSILNEMLEEKRKTARKIIAVPQFSETEKDKMFFDTTGYSAKNFNEKNFYNSLRWKELKKETIELYGAECMNPKCKSRENIHVDHIKPISKYPEKKLDPDNLQILCETCNLKKGGDDLEEWNFKKYHARYKREIKK